jgi:hypothetical protein
MVSALDNCIAVLRSRLRDVHRASGIDAVVVVARLEQLREEIVALQYHNAREQSPPPRIAAEVAQAAYVLGAA